VGDAFDPLPVLRRLNEAGVDFVIIGGLAGILYGSDYPTSDVDIAYARERENLERLGEVLQSLDASLRGAPKNLPFRPDADTLAAGLNFTFDTAFGSVDILGDPAGAPPYAELRQASKAVPLREIEVRIASLDHLIAMKEAAGRPRDKLMASEYRILADEIRASQR
jgi:hypothetical protein